jgi:hypothetical protein
MHTAEPLVPEPILFKVEISNENLRRYKLSGTDQILAELIQAGGNTLCSEMHKLILFGIRKNCHSSGRNFIITKGVIKLNVVFLQEYHCYQLHTKFYPFFFS